MFGNKKNKVLEEKRQAVREQLADKRESFETDVTHMEESQKQIRQDAEQTMANLSELVSYAALNLEEEAALIRQIDELSAAFAQCYTEYETIRVLAEKQLETTIALVEENKHYTTPAKYLTEAPVALRSSKERSLTYLNRLEEDIKNGSSNTEKQVALLREEILSSKAEIDRLEEVVGHLVLLMKENNMGTTRLLKRTQEVNQAVGSSTMRDFSKDALLMRDKVVGLRNLDEEIAKTGERSKLQLNDIREEAAEQKNLLAEVESDISYLCDILLEKK